MVDSLKDVKVVAFDIDGTLYPTMGLYIRLVPYFLRHLRFFIHWGRVRRVMHRTAPLPDYYEYQSRLMALELNISVADAREKIQKIVYDGLRPYFERIKPYKNMEKTFKVLKDAGYKIALLSDFPPSQKGSLWGITPYCSFIFGTEDLGALKPSKYPFALMAKALEEKSENILYVGNSIKYDVLGAKNAGMKSAYILPFWRKLLGKIPKEADICFSNYRQFIDIVVK